MPGNEYSRAAGQYRDGAIKPEGTVLFSKSSSVILNTQGVTKYSRLIKAGEGRMGMKIYGR